MENNELIARFMGCELIIPKKECYEPYYREFRDDGIRIRRDTCISDLKYHKYWEWLMPVVEKICRLKIGDGKEFVDYPNLRTFGMLNEETGKILVRFNGFMVFQSDTLIESTYLAVVDFIKWWSDKN